MENHSTAPEPTEGFRDPTALTRWTRGFLYASIATALVRLGSDAANLLGTEGVGESAGTAFDLFWFLTGVPIWLITAILVLTWIHRANHNARQLGAAGMHFTPGWAVGWHFVPIAWFWKPYQAMTEIWRASRNPADWRDEPVSPLLRWWWILWIVPFWGVVIVELTVARTLAAMTGPGLLPFTAPAVASLEAAAAAAGLVYWILEIPLILVLLAIIGAVHRMQKQHRARWVAVG